MHASPLPTDSILRRHFEQLAAAAGLPQPPQDSVLLRHYRQLLDARLARTATPVAVQRTVPKAAAPEGRNAPTPQRAAAEAQPVMRSQPAHAPREAAAIPDRNPPPAAATSWFSRLLARIFGN